MKIIQMIYSLSSGGAEKFVVDLANEQALMGHDVTVCILLTDENDDFTFNKQFLSPKVHYCSMGFKPGFSIKKVRTVCNYIRSMKPDIVHCHLNVIPYIFPLALLDKKIKFFHTLHNVAEHASGGGIQWKLNRYFYKDSKIYPVCISKLCQKSYETFYGLHNSPYVDNGRTEIPVTAHIESVRKEIKSYKVSDKTLVFIHVARCNPQKNQQLLVDAFNELNKEGVDFCLIIIGSGFDGEEGNKLRDKACSRIHILGERNNVNDYLHCSNAFCLSSNFEGLPISLLEALSCGITPICTPVGGIPDVITDGVNGYLSHSLKTDDYVMAIKRFIARPLSANDLINYYRNNYSMDICAYKYINLYNKAIND